MTDTDPDEPQANSPPWPTFSLDTGCPTCGKPWPETRHENGRPVWAKCPWHWEWNGINMISLSGGVPPI